MRTLLLGPLALLLLGCGDPEARITLKTELGDIQVELDPVRAPITVTNFLRYVDEDRFQGATFYRVVTLNNQPVSPVKIEVIQGGLGDQEGRLPAIAHETTETTGILHTDGTISMARLEPGTATAEFFICVGDQPELDFGGNRNPDGQGFAAFGRVIEGMDVVREIQSLPETGQTLSRPLRILSVRRQQ